MSKIVVAANSMIANSDKITDIVTGISGNVYYFLYDKKHKWSIYYDDDDYSPAYILNYFSSNKSLKEICDMGTQEWQKFNEFISYSTKEIGTKEAYNTFRELYIIVKEKILNVSDALDEIIGEGIV
jgi:hypothetical protein